MEKARKVKIGVSGSFMIDEGGMFPGYRRAYVNDDYIQSVVMAGGVPYIIPVVYDDDVMREQLENVDALILSGGHDINPLEWGEEPSQKLGGILPLRDTFDFKLLKIAMEMKKPILGICRGEHIINVANGGSLYQDLSFIDGCYIKHNQEHLSNIPTHHVNVEKDSKLENIIGESTLINSFHHLAVKDVAPGFKVCARAKDGVVEAIEKEGEEFIIGVQWHPEMMTKDCPEMLKIFKALVEEAQNKIK